MVDRTGLLKKSPLIYTFASIRFAPWTLIGSKVPQIHEQLRDILPLLQAVEGQFVPTAGVALGSVQGGGAANLNVWAMLSVDRSYGIQVSSDQMLFFVIHGYKTYSEFSDLIKRGIQVVLDHMKFMHVTSMGIRYIDYIKTRNPEEQLSQYVADELLMPTLGELKPIGGVIQGVYSSPNGELRVRSISQPSLWSVPGDVVPLLAMIQSPSSPLRIDVLKPGEMLLDIDSIRTNTQPIKLDANEIMKQFHSLHVDANAFFRHESVCKDFAFQVWQEKI